MPICISDALIVISTKKHVSVRLVAVEGSRVDGVADGKRNTIEKAVKNGEKDGKRTF